jgi:uncharacterized protein YceH (UPF0502 family)
VAHTQQNVIIPAKAPGERVNIEVDVLAKMVERSLQGVNAQQAASAPNNAVVEALAARVKALEEKVEQLLAKHGP